MTLNESLPSVEWRESELEHSALWRSERRPLPPKRLLVVDDSLSADRAFRLVCEGTTLLWRGDYHLAKQLLQAMGRRIDATGQGKGRRRQADTPAELVSDLQSYHQYRQRRSRRAQLMSCLVVPMGGDYRLALRRAPDLRSACAQAWGPPPETSRAETWLVPLTDLLGILGAHQWHLTGVRVAALGPPPGDRIYPHYGVFAPTRDEYVELVSRAPLPQTGASPYVAFDIGTGTGVLAAVLARRRVERVIATDISHRALVCAADNLERLALAETIQLLQTELFPPGLASLVVCNPPWLPGRAGSSLERAIYDPESRMLMGFLSRLGDHLEAGGEGWLILSDLAELLGLRSREALLSAFAKANLRVVGKLEIKARHAKASRLSDPLHRFRAAEVTSLWRLTTKPPTS